MKKRTLPNIEVTEIRNDARVAWYKVTRDGVLLGFLEKWRDDAHTTNPWKAFEPRFVAGSPAQFGRMVGTFYNFNRDGRQAAISALATLAS